MDDKLHQDEPLQSDTRLPVRSGRQRFTAVIIILAVLAGGFFMARTLLQSKPEARRKKPPKMKTVVRLQPLAPADVTLAVEAMGTVIAAQQLELRPRVSGRVIGVNPDLIPGSRLQQGDLILKIDEQDYKLALQRSENDLEKAAMDLRLEQGNQAVARQEFELIREYAETAVNDAPVDLALRKPQLAKAKATEAAARAQVEQAKLDLARTSLVTPFNSVVLDKHVAVGAQLSSQTTVATLAGTDAFWIRISLPRRELSDILLPSADTPQVAVTLHPVPLEGQQQWRGTILRLLPDVDDRGLMARLLISVADPLEQDPVNPLLLGSMVQVRLPGKILKGCFVIPRTAVLPDRSVLLADQENRLEVRPVTVARMDRDHAYVTSGLQAGERLVISPLAAPIAGMQLTPATAQQSVSLDPETRP